MKDYSVHLQRRIKILRDPSCFCPNVDSNTSKIFGRENILIILHLDGTKEQTNDDFNNTMTSTRSVSSISSATSNGYRHPSQW